MAWFSGAGLTRCDVRHIRQRGPQPLTMGLATPRRAVSISERTCACVSAGRVGSGKAGASAGKPVVAPGLAAGSGVMASLRNDLGGHGRGGSGLRSCATRGCPATINVRICTGRWRGWLSGRPGNVGVVAEVGSGLSGKRGSGLSEPCASVIVAEHRGRLGRLGWASRSGPGGAQQGGRLAVVCEARAPAAWCGTWSRC